MTAYTTELFTASCIACVCVASLKNGRGGRRYYSDDEDELSGSGSGSGDDIILGGHWGAGGSKHDAPGERNDKQLVCWLGRVTCTSAQYMQ